MIMFVPHTIDDLLRTCLYTFSPNFGNRLPETVLHLNFTVWVFKLVLSAILCAYVTTI